MKAAAFRNGRCLRLMLALGKSETAGVQRAGRLLSVRWRLQSRSPRLSPLFIGVEITEALPMALGGENSVPLQSMFPERRAAAAMALGFSVLALGWRLPLPGLDLGNLYSYSPSGDVAARFSTFALDLLPLFTVLAHAELARLAIPPLARWQGRSSGNDRRWSVMVCALSLLLAALQGYSVLDALAATDVLRSGSVGLVVAGLATFVASATLMLWLAERIGDSSSSGGFWSLMAMIFLADAPGRASDLIEQMRVGQISGSQLLATAACLAVGIALVVFVNPLVQQDGRADGAAKASILLWPPYLASVVAGHAIALLPAGLPAWPFLYPSFLEAEHMTLVVVFIPLLVLAYARLSPQPRNRLPAPVILAIAAIQIILCLGAWLLPASQGLPQIVSGAELLVAGTVLLGLRRSSGIRQQAS